MVYGIGRKCASQNMNEKIRNILNEVKDPEIPALSVVDMGIIRAVRENDVLEIDITPTYTGCPAMDRIERDLIDKLKEKGYQTVKINTVLSPPWTTDWISEDGLRRLEEFGIAPPVKGTADKRALFQEAPKPRCPYCKSPETQMISAFGSTACKAQYKCNSCKEPFDYFKCI
jgi:ring-1,2-phenylacetyl-CoA epoxidase subunit PaaD